MAVAGSAAALTAALSGAPLPVYGDGLQRRDFTYVGDVIAAATVPAGSGVINVGGGSGASLGDVIDIARRLTGRPIRLSPRPSPDGDVPVTRADITRAGSLLGWRPEVELPDGMRAQLGALISPGPVEF